MRADDNYNAGSYIISVLPGVIQSTIREFKMERRIGTTIGFKASHQMIRHGALSVRYQGLIRQVKLIMFMNDFLTILT